MALPFDFQSLVYAFDSSSVTNITFEEWSGNSQVYAGTAVDLGYVPRVLSPQFAFVPRVPKDMIERMPEGDRHRSGCLVWSVAEDELGTTYNTLRTIDQVTHNRPDRIVDNDRGLTYIVVTSWVYGRQSKIAGAIGVLRDEP